MQSQTRPTKAPKISSRSQTVRLLVAFIAFLIVAATGFLGGIFFRTRMIALTANAQEEDREAALAAGLDGLLVKPLDRERLCELLDAALAGASNPLAA